MKLTVLHKTAGQIPPLLKYLNYSILVTIMDVAIVWILHRFFNINIVYANTAGVLSGFVLHYLLSTNSVFNFKYSAIGFIIYFITFLFGLCLADALIYIGKYYMFKSMNFNMNFLFSKGLSIVVPFFILYYLRKYLYGLVKKSEENL